MHLYTKSALLICLSFFWAYPSLQAQAVQPRINASHAHTWMQYFGNHKFSKRWGLHTEVQVRRTVMLDEWQQLL